MGYRGSYLGEMPKAVCRVGHAVLPAVELGSESGRYKAKEGGHWIGRRRLVRGWVTVRLPIRAETVKDVIWVLFWKHSLDRETRQQTPGRRRGEECIEMSWKCTRSRAELCEEMRFDAPHSLRAPSRNKRYLAADRKEMGSS